MSKVETKSYTIDPVDSARKRGIYFQECAWSITGHSFPEILHNEGLQIKSYQPANEAGVELVFSVPASKNPQKDLKIGMSEAKVIFDPGHDWRILRYEFKLPGVPDSSVMGTIDYFQHGLIEKLSQMTKVGAKYNVTALVNVDSIEFKNLTEGDFSLSAYGLPEPTDSPVAAAGTAGWSFWLIVAAIAALLGGGYLGRRARRTAQGSTVTAPVSRSGE